MARGSSGGCASSHHYRAATTMATMTVVDDVGSNNQPVVTAGYTISIANTTPQASSSDNGQKN